MYETDSGSLGLYITGDDSQLLTTDVFREFYKEMAGRYARTGVFYLLPLLLLVWAAAEFYVRKIWRQREGMTSLKSNVWNVSVSCFSPPGR